MLVASSSVSLWQVGSAAPMLTARHPGLLAGASAISPDGREIAVAWLHQGATAFVEIDRAGAARPVVLRANPEQMAFSADGTQLALASPSSPQALIYDAPSGRFERALVVAGGHSPADVTYARDAPRVAVSYAGGVQVFDQRTGQRVGPLLRNPLGNYAVALSADGRQVVAGGDTASDATGVANSEVLDWSLPSGTLLSTLVQGNNRSVSAQFSRDGRFVLTSTENDQTFVFEAATGDRLLQYPGANPSWDDSAHLIADTSVPDGPGPLYGYVWPCDVCTGVRGLIALANARVTRGFTPGERKKFLAGLT
jgi:WD40 repeat protein